MGADNIEEELKDEYTFGQLSSLASFFVPTSYQASLVRNKYI